MMYWGVDMEYEKILQECKDRAEVYRKCDAIWNLTHEEQCYKAITELLERVERAENAETRLRYAEECAAALELLLKAIDGEEKLENVTSLAKTNLKKYKQKYPGPKLKFNK